MQSLPDFAGWLVHICPSQAWLQAQHAREYQAPSLASEGFIHFSTPEQVLWVANAFYRDTPDLLLLWIDVRRLQSELRWEEVGEQRFPHLYGPLNLDAVRQASAFRPAADGQYHDLPQRPG